MPAVVVIRDGEAPRPSWLEGLDAAEITPSGNTTLDSSEAFRSAECALIDAQSLDAIAAARQVHRADRDLQVIIVGETEETRRSLQRAVVFSPGLGEVWLASPREVAAAIAERAAGVTRKRRSFRRTHERISGEAIMRSPQQTERALISDAYLADLLQVTPDPVFSVDAAGRILSANPASERVLGRQGQELRGAMLSSLLPSVDAGELSRMLVRAAQEPAHAEVEFARGDGRSGFGELLVAKVGRSEPALFAVVLHDLTDRVAAQRQLEDQAVELEHQAATLHEQAAELEQVNEELMEQRTALEHALDARGRFYASMSHELRTPINAVIGYNSLVLDGVYGELSQQQRDAIGRSQRAAAHLLELVNDVLDLAKIEAGRLEVIPEPVNPRSLVEDLLVSVRPVADAHDTELRFECEVSSHARIVTDPRRVRQILLNLVSNAVKFGNGKPVVVRCASLEEGRVAFHVIDQGQGIPPADQQRVFEEFVQLETSSHSGTGLGLSISRRLARLLGGELTLHSVPGEGSTFTLTLPREVEAS